MTAGRGEEIRSGKQGGEQPRGPLVGMCMSGSRRSPGVKGGREAGPPHPHPPMLSVHAPLTSCGIWGQFLINPISFLRQVLTIRSQAGLKLLILLPGPPECWNERLYGALLGSLTSLILVASTV